ncbi:hypothetical protein Lser_V15G05695 [Lactuca serriola]
MCVDCRRSRFPIFPTIMTHWSRRLAERSNTTCTFSLSLSLSGAVTLLALGNGAPDVFPSVASVGGGNPRTGFDAILSVESFVSALVVGFVAIYAAPFAVSPAPCGSGILLRGRSLLEQWMARYGRVYKDADEKEQRSKIFQENVRYIESSNSVMNKAYKLAVNEFADLINQEFTSTRNRFKAHECSPSTSAFRYENVTAVPSSMDWRKKGAVTPVKDQGQCGCCWAF